MLFRACGIHSDSTVYTSKTFRSPGAFSLVLMTTLKVSLGHNFQSVPKEATMPPAKASMYTLTLISYLSPTTEWSQK